MSHPIPPEKFTRFLDELRHTPNAERAARIAGASVGTFAKYRKSDPEFDAAWSAALEQGLDHTESIVHQRAFYGTNKPLTNQGRLTYQQDFTAIDPDTGLFFLPHLAPLKRDERGDLIPLTVPEVSDTLAMFLLKAYRPEKYRERSDVNVTGTVDIAGAILAARKRSGTTSTD